VRLRVGGDTGDEGHVRSDGQTTHEECGVTPESIAELRANLFGPCPEQPDPWQLREMLEEIERLKWHEVAAQEGHEGRDLSLSWSCECMRSGVEKFDIPVDFSKKDVERHFRSWPRRAKAALAAHVEAIMDGGAK
jgi:hypothetical protein